MKKILDVGCGTGDLLNYIAKRNKKVLLWGVDISKDVLKRAEKNKYSKREIFKKINANKLPFEDNFFNEVYCYEVLEHVEDLDKVLKEIKRVLKSKGKLNITVPLKKSENILIKYNKDYPNQIGHKRFFSKKDISALLSENKFKVKKHISYNSIEHLFWRAIFKKGGKIINQLGEVDKRPGKIWRILNIILSREIFYMKDLTKSKLYKKIINFLIIFYPLGVLLDKFSINKKQKVVSINEK